MHWKNSSNFLSVSSHIFWHFVFDLQITQTMGKIFSFFSLFLFDGSDFYFGMSSQASRGSCKRPAKPSQRPSTLASPLSQGRPTLTLLSFLYCENHSDPPHKLSCSFPPLYFGLADLISPSEFFLASSADKDANHQAHLRREIVELFE